MAYTGYLHIVGKVQEEIETDLDKEGREGGIPFFSFRHLVSIPAKDEIVNPELTPRHGVITATKQVDITSPKLYRALCTKELLTTVDFNWFEHQDGMEEEVYRIQLRDCFLASIQTDARSRGEGEEGFIQETLTFHYAAIRWHYGDSEGDEFFDFDTMGSLA